MSFIRLENEAQYVATMSRLRELSKAKPAPGTSEHAEIAQLHDAVADYERRTVYLPSVSKHGPNSGTEGESK